MPPHLAALAALVHQCVARAQRRRRRIELALDHRQKGLRHIGEGAERLGVFLREFGDVGDGAFAVAIHAERGAVLEHADHRHVGKDVAQAEFRFQSQIVVLQKRIALNEDVRHRMLVVQEARHGEFARHHAAAEPGVALKHQYLLARRRHVRRGNQAVVAGADGDDVVCFGHAVQLVIDWMYAVSMYSRMAKIMSSLTSTIQA